MAENGIPAPHGAGMEPRWSTDQTLVRSRAAARGWHMVWEPEGRNGGAGGRLRLTRPGRTLVALFSHDGEFAYGRALGAGSGRLELLLAEVLDALEEDGTAAGTDSGQAAGGRGRRAGPAPTETPPAEGSTTAGISVPEPVELRQAWGPWPLVVIGLLVLCVVVFLVARIFAW
ncbi:DUF6480 family protein [Kitasatospora sp. NBC_01250]|uniref:DUF6480 family protein n=1 Tax=unclassified Kitasatospora TaxID=2633591 RepID=UPI002E0F2B98|nr:MULTISPECIES: DUF6480 family protein [unclassified Kitasatospora]WSJ64680.1 DUF6480 family protein [Kitasatospora sp. NBC_01302]